MFCEKDGAKMWLFGRFLCHQFVNHACTYACASLLFVFFLEEKQLVDRLLCIEKMLIVCSSQMKQNKVGFLRSVLFYGHLNWLSGLITFLWLMMWLIVVGCQIPWGMGNIFIYSFQVLYCIAG